MATLFALDTPVFGVKTHNGKVTVSNPATGQHRTFRIRTQKKNANWAPGKRVVSLLVGPDNQSAYRGFGFVNDDGTVNVWQKHRGTKMDTYAKLLEDPQSASDKWGMTFEWSVLCRRCNKELTNPESIRSGLGDVCRGVANG